MPYTRKGKCVYNKETGKKKGCSASVDKAKDYLKALYASEIKEYLLLLSPQRTVPFNICVSILF